MLYTGLTLNDDYRPESDISMRSNAQAYNTNRDVDDIHKGTPPTSH